jgi:hypothetical protein
MDYALDLVKVTRFELMASSSRTHEYTVEDRVNVRREAAGGEVGSRGSLLSALEFAGIGSP